MDAGAVEWKAFVGGLEIGDAVAPGCEEGEDPLVEEGICGLGVGNDPGAEFVLFCFFAFSVADPPDGYMDTDEEWVRDEFGLRVDCTGGTAVDCPGRVGRVGDCEGIW